MNFSAKDLGKGGTHLAQMIQQSKPDQINQRPAKELPIRDIQVFQQVRGIQFEHLNVDDLLTSVKELGIIQPLLVCPIANGDDYALIAGHRRLRAASLLDFDKVPVCLKDDVVYDPANPERNEAFMCLQLTENIQRQDLEPLQECFAIQRYRDQFALNNSQLSAKLGISRAKLVDTIRVASFFGPLVEGVKRLTPSESEMAETSHGENPKVEDRQSRNPGQALKKNSAKRLTPNIGHEASTGMEKAIPHVTASDFENPHKLLAEGLEGVKRLTPVQLDDETRQKLLTLPRSSLILLSSVGDHPYFSTVMRRLLDRESIRTVKNFIKNQQKKVEAAQTPPISKPTTFKNLVKIGVNPAVSGISGFEFDPEALAAESDLNPDETRQALAQFRVKVLEAIELGLLKLLPDKAFDLSLNLTLHAREPGCAPASARLENISKTNLVSFSGKENGDKTSPQPNGAKVQKEMAPGNLRPSNLVKLGKPVRETETQTPTLATWFEKSFWPKFPTRQGKRRGKAKARAWVLKNFEAKPPNFLVNVMLALDEYVAEQGEDGDFVKDPVRWLPDWQDYLPAEEAKARCHTCGGSGKVEGRDNNHKLIAKNCPTCTGDA